MLMLLAVLLSWEAGSMSGMAQCRTVRSGNIGPDTSWQTDGRGRIWLSTTAAQTGTVELRCRISQGSIEVDRVHISFQPAGSPATGSGLLIRAGALAWHIERVAGEDWIEVRKRSGAAAGRLLIVRAEDRSGADPMRVEVEGLRVTADSP